MVDGSGYRVMKVGLPTNGSENFAPRPMTNRVDLMTIMNGAVSIPADQEVIFEEGVPYLKSNTTAVVDYQHHQPVSFRTVCT